jgi:hypothetical protein
VNVPKEAEMRINANRRRKESSSFLKKRTKKLLCLKRGPSEEVRDSHSKSFAFFFRKEGLVLILLAARV